MLLWVWVCVCVCVWIFLEDTTLLLWGCVCVSVCAESLQSCPTLCNSMDCNPPCSSVHGASQARILEWAAMPSSRGSSLPRDQTHVSYMSCTAGGFFTTLYVAQLLLCCNAVKHFWPLMLTYASKKHMVVLILCICSWLSGMWLLCFMYYLQLSWGWWSWSPQELSRRPLCHHLLQVSPLPRGRRLSLRATLSRWTISYLTEILWLLYHFIL